MAVNWGSLIFGGVNSSDYGIYLSGEGVYNAPERAVEVVDVPGRNGSVIIDQGHWNNIEVVYRAGVFGADQAGFSEKLSAFRNAILSQKGYQRLEDTYHPEEFRMGAYVSGLEVSPASYNRHGEFELIFNCKPQRWLVDGELLVPVNTLDVLQNPTEYDSSPLLQIKGYGNVGFNGYEIDLSASDPLGEVTLSEKGIWPQRYDSSSGQTSIVNTFTTTVSLNDLLVAGDPIYLGNPDNTPECVYCTYRLYVKSDATLTNLDITNISSGLNPSHSDFNNRYTTIRSWFDKDVVVFEYGTSGLYEGTFTLSGKISGADFYCTCTNKVEYDGAHTLTFTVKLGSFASMDASAINSFMLSSSNKGVYIPQSGSGIYGDSTLPAYGDLVVDCDLGEAYKITGDEIVPLNSIIDLGSDLPLLAPGANVITADNTITDLKIAPRWWKL